MTVIKSFIYPNEYSRPQKKIREVRAIVLHWTANPKSDAAENVTFFNMRKTGKLGYGSAHYVIGQKGEIYQCLPEDEIAYHCGTDKTDPQSNRIYTDKAREMLGYYCTAYDVTSPNFCTLGIELCPVDWSGNFSTETIRAAAELCAQLLKKYALTVESLVTHHEIVGWKDCPKLWTEKPELFDAFKKTVLDIIIRGYIA